MCSFEMDALEIPLLPENYAQSKSRSELIEDLSKTLSPDGTTVKTDSIPKLWTYYLELNVEPAGWQALWKPGRGTRGEAKEIFTGPTVVEVVNVDYACHEATVESLEQDDSRGKQCTVYLTELYALRDQENSAVLIEKTHLALQKLRFFYEHLWFPWDLDNDSTDWITTHLEYRVALFCEIRSGLVPKEITARYYNLISEAFQLHKQLTAAEEKIEKKDLEDQEADPDEIAHVARLNDQLENIQKEFELMYNPNTRMALFASANTMERSSDKPEVLLVINGRTVEQLKVMIAAVESLVTFETIRSFPSFQAAVNECCANDTIILPPGLHSYLHFGNLEYGGTVIGIGKNEDVLLHNAHAPDIAISIDCAPHHKVLLKNLTLSVDARKSGVLVKNGLIQLENCVLKGPLRSATREESPSQSSPIAWKGLIAGPDSIISLNKCKVQNFDVGLRIRQDAQVKMKETLVESCNIGILTEKDARLVLSATKIYDSKECGVIVEVEGSNEDLQSPSDDTGALTKILSVPEGSLDFKNNARNVKVEFIEVEDDTDEEESAQA